MALSYDCERILGTIEWAHQGLWQHGRGNGRAMDVLMGKLRSERASSAPERASRYARYLRGDNVPRADAVFGLLGDDLRVNYWQLPLFDLLRVGVDGYGTRDGRNSVEFALDDLQRRFVRRITSYEGPGLTQVSVQPSRKIVLELCAYGSCHATAVLLAWAIDLQQQRDEFETRPDDFGAPPFNPLYVGQRAFQCLIFAFAQGEFPVTGPLVAARVRQQVLDHLKADGQVLDTASIDVDAAVATAREVLDPAREGRANPFQQRAALRAWLKSQSLALEGVTPQITSPALAEAARQARPVALHLQAVDERGRPRLFGKRAQATLLEAMVGYVSSAGSTWRSNPPQDQSGAHDRGDLDCAGTGPVARI